MTHPTNTPAISLPQPYASPSGIGDVWTREQVIAAIEADRKCRGEPVAYLDLGVGGYMDVGTDLTDEQLAALPKGRHMLGIIGTYGVDGYREVAPQPAEPDVLPGEAILGFAAWLTSLKTPVTFSECHGAAIGADLAAAYNTSQGFIQVREDFHKRLKPYPKYEPSQPAEPVAKWLANMRPMDAVESRAAYEAYQQMVDAAPVAAQPVSGADGLLPCPFCGGAAKQYDRFNASTVKCKSCGAKVSQSEMGQGDAPERWNCRAQPQPSGNPGDLPDSLIPATPDLEYLRSMASGDNLPATLRGNILAAVRRIEAAQPSGRAQPVIHQHGFAADNQRLRAVNESLDRQLEEAMTQRDECHDMADKLAQAIADHLLVEIGEHSSANCPWMRALEALESAPSPGAQAQQNAEDAARYRDIRRGQRWSVIDGIGNTLRAEDLDAAVDAARQGQGGE